MTSRRGLCSRVPRLGLSPHKGEIGDGRQAQGQSQDDFYAPGQVARCDEPLDRSGHDKHGYRSQDQQYGITRPFAKRRFSR